MKITAIQASAPTASPERQGGLRVPAQYLLEALADAAVNDSGRKLVLDTLSAWGSVAARVAGQNPDGSTLLDVAGVRIALRLPEARSAGQTIMLGVTDAHRLPSIVARGEAAFSAVARILAGLTAHAEAGPREAATLPLSSAQVQADGLASALRLSVADSGLFYESHLARWTGNDYRLADLMREPQFRASLGGNQDLGPHGLPGERPAVVAERLFPVLKQQLTALETQTIPWNGTLWPGQQGEIEIQQQPPQAEGPAAHPEVWITRVRLDLPRLGSVETLVALSGSRVAMSIASASASTAVELTAASAKLEAAIVARGIQPDGLLVRHQEG